MDSPDRGPLRPRGMTALLWTLGLLALAPASRALASGGGGESGASGGTALTIVVLLLLVGSAYLLAHFVVERIQEAFLVLLGVEYLFLGFLLGGEMPYHILDLQLGEGASALLPIIALAVGWVGLLRGMELDLRAYRGSPSTGSLRVGIYQGVITGVMTGGGAYWFLSSGIPFAVTPERVHGCATFEEVAISSAVLGCVAATGSIEPIELLRRRYRLTEEMGERIRRMAATSDLIALVCFGLLFCIFHNQSRSGQVSLTPTEWAVVTVFLGVILGILFTPYLGKDDSENGRFLAMAGIISFASGAAYFLDLSPLLVNLCLGAVLVNTSRTGRSIRATLDSTKGPMSLVLYVFAGALVTLPERWEWLLAMSASYLLVRFVGKWIGTRLAALGTDLRRDYYRGLMSHGTVSIAMAVSFRLVYQGPAVDLAFAVILASAVLNDLFAPRLLRGLLVDSGDLRGEVEARTTLLSSVPER